MAVLGGLGLVIVAPHGAAAPLAIFGPAVPQPGSPASVAVAVGDVDGDGVPDLVTANPEGTVSIHRGNGTGGFIRSDIPAGANPIAVGIADLNEDGRPDLVVVNHTDAGTLTILLGTGGGAFAPAPGPPVAVGGFPQGLAIGDLDRDGHLDVVTSNTTSKTVSVRRGTGTGTFIAAADVSTGNGPTAVGLGDLDRDGVLDLVIVNTLDSTVVVRRGLGTGVFGPASAPFATGASPQAMAIADLNRDGKLDVIVACVLGGDVSVLLGTGTGTLGAAQSFPTGLAPSGVAVAEVNDDGRLDVVVVDSADAAVSVLLGRGDGTLQPRVFLPTAAAPPGGLAIADLDRDGRPDLAVAGAPAAVHLNDAVFAVGEWESFSSDAVDAGVAPSFVALGDFNRDGALDAAVANVGPPGSVTIHLGAGNGTFAAAPPVDGGPSPHAIAVADLNRDGRLDLVVSNLFDARIVVLLGNGAGGFAATPSSPIVTGSSPGPPVAADVNGDGIPDILVPSADANTIAVLLGDGAGGFAAATPLQTVDSPMSVAVGDLNGDGALDVVVVHNDSGSTLSVFLGVGDGTFGARDDVASFPAPRAVVLADVNRDGHLDALVGSIMSLAVHLGDGTGALPLTSSQGLPVTGDRGVAIADLDRNGILDVVTTGDNPDSQVALGFGNGNGGFSVVGPFSTGSDPQGAAVGDLNGDGRLDVVVANHDDGTISVLLAGARVTLRVAGEGSGTGVIRSSDFQLACGTDEFGQHTGCSVEYSVTPGFTNDPVTLTFHPGPGTKFLGWRGAGCTGTDQCAVTVDGAVEVTALHELQPPTSDGLIPEVALAGVGLSISVTGTNFTSSTQISVGGTLLNASVNFDGTALSAFVSGDLVVAPLDGPPQIEIRACTPTVGCSSNFRLLNVFFLVPSQASAGAQNVVLTVRGGIFSGSSTIEWDGVPLPTEFVDGFTLRTTLTADNLQFPGQESQVRVVNLLGGGEPPIMTFRVTVDGTPPTVSVTSPAANGVVTRDSPFTLGGTAADDVGVTLVSWSSDRGGAGDAVGTTAWTASGIVLQQGTNVLTVTARDAAENSASTTRTVVFDGVPPTVAITAPTSGATHATTATAIALGGTAADDPAVTQVSWVNSRGGSGVATGTTAWSVASIALQPGVNVITVTARDAAGNTATDVLTVTRDTANPSVTITSPTTQATLLTSAALILGGTASDDGGVAQVSWATDRGFAGQASGTTAWSAPVPLAVGRNVVTVTARDLVDRTATDTIVVFFFTDLLGSTMPVKALHFLELKTAIDQQRARASLPPLAWTQAPPKAGDPVRLSHLLDLRTALAVLFAQPPALTDPSPTAGVTPVRAVHLNELRQRVRDLQ
jgi:hypothetical protein